MGAFRGAADDFDFAVLRQGAEARAKLRKRDFDRARHPFAGRRSFEFLSMVGFAIPGTVIGVSSIVAFNVPPLELTGGMLILVLCFVFRNMPVGVRAGVAALAQIDRTLDEASSTLRASTLRTLTQVVVPLLRPAIIATLVFSFTHAMTAVSAVVFSRSRIGFASTTSNEPAIPDSEISSHARCASR